MITWYQTRHERRSPGWHSVTSTQTTSAEGRYGSPLSFQVRQSQETRVLKVHGFILREGKCCSRSQIKDKKKSGKGKYNRTCVSVRCFGVGSARETVGGTNWGAAIKEDDATGSRKERALKVS